MAAVAALPVVEAVRIVVERSHVVLFGDQALLELGARRAAHLDQLVGPYSREGFHHPGPAVFYLLAPFVRILEPTGPGVYLGAIALSGGALVATVVFLWRRFGPVAALWAAAAIDLYCLCLRVGTLREPWNPYLVLTPMVLFVVLWSAGITGTAGAGVWAVVVGSYEVQTHIATAGFVVTMSVILVGWTSVSAWRRGDAPRRGVRRWAARDRWGPARITGTTALAAIWLAPAVELWRDRPDNFQLLWRFFTTAHPEPALAEALRAEATAVTVMPFGNRDYVQTLSRSPAQVAVGAALLLAGLVIAVILARRRDQPMAMALAASSVLGVLLGAVSLSQTAGPVYLYLALWLAYVPLSLLLAIGVALLAPAYQTPPVSRAGRPTSRPELPPTSRRQARPARGAAPVRGLAAPVVALGVVVAVLAGGLTVRSDLGMGPVRTTVIGGGPWPGQTAGSAQGRARSRLDAITLTRAAEGVLRPTDRWVAFTVGTASLWPYVAGMVLELDERGVQSTVGPAGWDLYFGQERAPGHTVSGSFTLSAADDAVSPNPPDSTIVARVDGVVLAYRRTSA